MATIIQLGKDGNGNVSYDIPFSITNTSTTLAAGTAQSVTVPTNVTKAFFSYNPGASVWVSVDGTTAAVPSTSFAATSSVLNPQGRWVQAGQSLSFITADATAYVSIAFYNGGS